MGARKQKKKANSLGNSSKRSFTSVLPHEVSSFHEEDKKTSSAPRTIYKVAEKKKSGDKKENTSTAASSIIGCLQIFIIVYLLTAMTYQFVWGEVRDLWAYLAEIMMFELIAGFVLIRLSNNHWIGVACLFLSYHFVLLFLMFSFFLQSSFSSKSRFVEQIFGMSAVSSMSTCAHFIIVVNAVQMIAKSKKRNDYGEKVIVEDVDKRRKDLYLMISDLISEICFDDKDSKLHLTIKDETGRPKTMSGAGIEAGVSRVLEMSMDGDKVSLSTSNTTQACIHVPNSSKKHKKRGSRSRSPHHEKSNLSKYNRCQKQDEMLSPRKILADENN